MPAQLGHHLGADRIVRLYDGQTRRADYWIRTRNVMRVEFKRLLEKPHREPRFSRITETMDRESMRARLDYPDAQDYEDSDETEDVVPSRVLETGPGNLI